MTHFIDPVRGAKKPIDIFSFLLSGEYDQGDVALVSYDDLYDMVYTEKDREEIKTRLKKAYETPNLIREDNLTAHKDI